MLKHRLFPLRHNFVFQFHGHAALGSDYHMTGNNYLGFLGDVEPSEFTYRTEKTFEPHNILSPLVVCLYFYTVCFSSFMAAQALMGE